MYSEVHDDDDDVHDRQSLRQLQMPDDQSRLPSGHAASPPPHDFTGCLVITSLLACIVIVLFGLQTKTQRRVARHCKSTIFIRQTDDVTVT